MDTRRSSANRYGQMERLRASSWVADGNYDNWKPKPRNGKPIPKETSRTAAEIEADDNAAMKGGE